VALARPTPDATPQPPPGATPRPAPGGPAPRTDGFADPQLEFASLQAQPEFLEIDEEPASAPEGPLRPRPDDLPPCGPRPQRPAPAAQPGSGNPGLGHDAIELDPGTALEAPAPVPPEAMPPAPSGFAQDAFRPSAHGPSDPGLLVEPAGSVARARKLLAQARHLVQLERTIEAVQTLEQAVRLPLDEEAAYEAWFLLGRLRSANPAWSARALHALQAANQLRPREAAPWALLAELHRRLGDEPEALACWRKALALNPGLAVPPDLDLREAPHPPNPAPTQAKGLLGAVRSLFGRRKD
jgi:hypothetical protein